MDDRRFDSLVRSLAAGASRRTVLKWLLGMGGAAMAGPMVTDTQAARRPAPTPKPLSCPGQQTAQGGQCVCLSPPASGPEKCGPDCCNPAGTGATHSECCDNACCFGTCYGEELCCSYPREFCAITGECCPDGWRCCPDYGCISPEQCCTDIDCVADPCYVGVCGTQQVCEFAFNCSTAEGCCPTETCTRSDCDGDSGQCGAPVSDCRYDLTGGGCCDEGLSCLEDGTCGCISNCTSLTCGNEDVCGGTCECGAGSSCRNGACVTVCGDIDDISNPCGPGGACTCHLDWQGEVAYCQNFNIGVGPCATDAECPAGTFCSWLASGQEPLESLCVYPC